MNPTLAQWNLVPEGAALETMLACCGAKRWARAMVAARPLTGVDDLTVAADKIWASMREADWLEAFACHPRIGERKAAPHANQQSTQWSGQEQAGTRDAASITMAALAEKNKLYEERFGFVYLICATGKTADEMLAILGSRLSGTRESELINAADEQRKITQIRLSKWLAQLEKDPQATAESNANAQAAQGENSVSKISTHILDTVLGTPAADVSVSLEIASGTEPHITWTEIARATSDSDGRVKELAFSAAAGAYRLTFFVEPYFARQSRQSLYTEITFGFRCDGESHYHLPVLLSNNGLTTYRGS